MIFVQVLIQSNLGIIQPPPPALVTHRYPLDKWACLEDPTLLGKTWVITDQVGIFSSLVGLKLFSKRCFKHTHLKCWDVNLFK